MVCAPARRQQGCWTSTFGTLAIYSVKKIEPWIQLKEEDYLPRARGFYWSFKGTEQELMSVLLSFFLSIFKTEGSLQGKHSMFSNTIVIRFRLHEPHMEGRGCKKHDLKSNIHSSVIQEKVCFLFHSQHPLFQTLWDSLFPDVNTGTWNQKVKCCAVLAKPQKPAHALEQIAASQTSWLCSQRGFQASQGLDRKSSTADIS